MPEKKQPIDQALIRQLALLLNETNLSEIEVEHDDLRIKVARNLATTTIAPVYEQPVPAQPAPAPVAAPAPAEPAKQEQPAGHTVPSPMVGTAYLASKPGDPPFVSVGDTVHEGQTLLIIEAMKHMNPIAAPKAGKVLQVLVDDGRPVEFGEPLVLLSAG